MLPMTKQLICKLEVLQPQPTVLTFRDFAPRLELLTLFRDFRRSMKMCEMNYFSLFCKSYLVLFLTFIIGTPILCFTTTDLGMFGTVLGIFGVAFVRALPAKHDSARIQLEVELRKILAFVQVRANENRLCQVFRSQISLTQFSYVKLIDEIQRAESPKYTIAQAYERGYTFEFGSDPAG